MCINWGFVACWKAFGLELGFFLWILLDSVVSAVGEPVLILFFGSLLLANGCCFASLLGSCCGEAGSLEGFLF